MDSLLLLAPYLHRVTPHLHRIYTKFTPNLHQIQKTEKYFVISTKNDINRKFQSNFVSIQETRSKIYIRLREVLVKGGCDDGRNCINGQAITVREFLGDVF